MRLGATPAPDRQLTDAHVDHRPDQCRFGCLGSEGLEDGGSSENEAEREDRAPSGAVGDDPDDTHDRANICGEPPTLRAIQPRRRGQQADRLGTNDQETMTQYGIGAIRPPYRNRHTTTAIGGPASTMGSRTWAFRRAPKA